MNPTARPWVDVIFRRHPGDHTQRKLLPRSLQKPRADGVSSAYQFAIVGFPATTMTPLHFRKMLTEEIPKYAGSRPHLYPSSGYGMIVIASTTSNAIFLDPEAYKAPGPALTEADKQHNTLGNRFFLCWPWLRGFFPPLLQCWAVLSD